MEQQNNNRIPIVSFFTGGGFMDMGFIESGFDVVYANEMHPPFIKIHDEGIESWCNANGYDFQKISSTDSITSIKDILQTAFNNDTPKVWGIIGGPPCQDFTMQGKGDGFKGKRGRMTEIFYNKIRKLKPAFFVMENVVGLLQRKDAKQTLDNLLLKYISNDYFVDRKILDALDYGVPQHRKRVFIVGLRKALYKPQMRNVQKDDIRTMQFNWPAVKFENALKYPWPKRNEFSKAIRKPDTIPYELCVQSCLKSETDSNIANIDEYPLFRKKIKEREDIDEGDTSRRSFRRLHRFRYSPTTCFGNNEIFLHPYENRRISVREALRIQGVSDDYILSEGNMSAKYKVISNGVPVPLAKAVATALFKEIERCQI